LETKNDGVMDDDDVQTLFVLMAHSHSPKTTFFDKIFDSFLILHAKGGRCYGPLNTHLPLLVFITVIVNEIKLLECIRG